MSPFQNMSVAPNARNKRCVVQGASDKLFGGVPRHGLYGAVMNIHHGIQAILQKPNDGRRLRPVGFDPPVQLHVWHTRHMWSDQLESTTMVSHYRVLHQAHSNLLMNKRNPLWGILPRDIRDSKLFHWVHFIDTIVTQNVPLSVSCIRWAMLHKSTTHQS